MTNNIIPVEIAKRFNIFELCGFEIPENSKPELQLNFYKDFLRKTDYIPAKMMEAQLAGETINEDYSAVLRYRKEAREKINALESGILSVSSSDANLSG